jgi:SulP family sulfate permease
MLGIERGAFLYGQLKEESRNKMRVENTSDPLLSTNTDCEPARAEAPIMNPTPVREGTLPHWRGLISFRPKLLDCLRDYSLAKFSTDLIAGLTVGIVALSLSMALGIASESTPAVGIYTAIVAGFVISALSGSKVQIGGPTAAFIPVVVGVMKTYGVDNLIICTLMAGLILVAMGIGRLGVMIKYIPVPVVTGFTAGIAIYIFSTQVKDFLGLNVANVPAEFIHKVVFLAKNVGGIHWPSVLVAATTLVFIRLWPAAWGKRVPASIVAVILGTIIVSLFHMDVATIGSRFGENAIPQSLPRPHWPEFDWKTVAHLINPAFTIALLAAIESLLCAVVADGMIEDRHDPNTELIAQGAGNMASALFGGLPATGAIARTATNIRCGGRTPVAGMFHAVVILLIVLMAAPWAKFIPLPILSAVLVVVALNMGEWHNFARLRRWPKSDALVYITTFVLTVLADITVAVKWGMVLGAMLFIKRVSETTQITAVDEKKLDLAPEDSIAGKEVPKGVLVYQLSGAFMVGSADKLENALLRLRQEPEVLILGMRRVLAMDATGLNALEELHHKLKRRGKYILLSGPHTQPLITMQNDGFIERLGPENACENLDTALARARQLLEQKKS